MGAQSSEPNQGTSTQNPPEGGEPVKPEQQELAGFRGTTTGQPLSSPQSGGSGAEGDKGTQGPQGGQGGGQGTQGAVEPVVLGHGGKPMPEEAISERVERARKAQLKELFGTEDEDEAKRIVEQGKKAPALTQEQLDEYARLRRLNESRARARMTEQQRLKADLDAREAKIQELETQLKSERDQNVVQQQDQIISSIAAQHVAEDYTKYANRDLAEYLKDLGAKDPEKLQSFGQKELSKWFKDYVAKKPAFAKQKASTEEGGGDDPATQTGGVPKQQPRKVVTRAVTSTKSSAQPPKPAPNDPTLVNGKTPKPGQPNSMNKQELREYLKQNNMRAW